MVRGLEALDQPSSVTLVTSSRYVNRGISYGLSDWGRNDWMWEHFGEMVPVKNRDLWQRLDRALKIHNMKGARYRFDGPHGVAFASDASLGTVELLPAGRGWLPALRAALAGFRGRMRERIERVWLSIAQLGTSLLPCPWLDSRELTAESGRVPG